MSPIHARPGVQPPQGPPQSTAVSPWFFTPSVHVGDRHILPPHTCEWQSVPTRQRPPSTQGAHDPPQSASVSSPFMCPSEQPGATQAPAVHILDRQSVPCWHICPVPHPTGQAPPQSTSVSTPFLT